MASLSRCINSGTLQKSVNLMCFKRNPNARLFHSCCEFVHTRHKKIENQFTYNPSSLISIFYLNGKSFHVLSKNFKDVEEDNVTKIDQNLLERDSELQNILDDIMKDFGDSSSPNDPPKLTKKSEEEKSSKNSEISNSSEKSVLPRSTDGKFEVFDESLTEEILDYDEEMQREFYLYQEKRDSDHPYNIKRGKEGVFDVAELVSVLKQENASDIAVLLIPEQLSYCDHMVIVTARSPKHIIALAEFINKLYKKKKSPQDKFIIPEGKACDDWKVLDMGNIVLHLFLEATRARYDLETLWTVGEQFDDLSNPEADPVLDMLQQHIQYLDEIEPLPVSQKQ